MKTPKFVTLLEEALKDGVSEILMYGAPGVSGTKIYFKYPAGHSEPYRYEIPFLDLQNFARGLKPSPRGHLAIGRSHVVYHIEMAPEMTQIYLSLKHAQKPVEFDLPAHAFDSIYKPGAFSIVSGLRGSGRSRLLQQIMISGARDRKKIVTGLFEEIEFDVPDEIRTWTQQENKLVPTWIFAGADIVAVDLKHHIPADDLLKAAERGTSVVLVVNAPHVGAGVFKTLSLFKSTLARERFSQVFECGIGLFAIKGATGDRLEHVNEICLATAQIREALLAGKFEEFLKKRTFNQTLLQYLLKRKIDLKAGFQLSPDPEELDTMLKKIGF